MSVDLVRYLSYYLLVYKNEKWYEQLPESQKKISIYDIADKAKANRSDPQLAASNLDPKNQMFEILVAHYCELYDRFNICDIGAHYGIVMMDLARAALSNGGRPDLFAFDAGIAGELTWRNFELNGFDVKFERSAVSAIDGHIPMFMEDGESTNNRIINAEGASELIGRSVAVRCMRLDNYLLKQNALRPSCVKIDVQGAEPAVLAGMSGLMASYPVSIQLEFTPWAMRRTGVEPIHFLDNLMQQNHIFDIGYIRQHVRIVNNAQETVVLVDESKPHWTDLLVIPKTLPGVEFILSKAKLSRPSGDTV